MVKNKGFTLTELLVVVVILGIITGISVPLIRGLSTSFEKKKYQNYADSVLSSAKLYTDSYSEDLFGHKDYGCAYITYDELVERDLLKDIEVDGVSCNSEKTYIRVTKQNDKYGYSNYLACGEKEDGKAKNIKTSIPEVIPDMNVDSCTGVADNNLVIGADMSQTGDVADKKRKKTYITITSGTGIDNKITMYAKWSSTRENESEDGWTSVSFKVKTNQEKDLSEGKEIFTKSTELLTPENVNGPYYLVVRVDHLQDLYGSNWKNPDPLKPNSKYVSFGPFNVDNENPSITVDVYKCNSNHVKTGSVLATKTVEYNDILYLNNITGSVDGWLNSSLVPYGLCLEYNVSDNEPLKSSLLEWNSEGSDENASGYRVLNGGSTSGSYNESSATISKSITGDGHRYVKLTVKDNASNETSLSVDFKLDTTGPTISAKVFKKDEHGNNGTTTELTKTVNTHDDMLLSGWNKYGVGYTFDVTDSFGVVSKTWQWNNEGLKSGTSGYTTLANASDPVTYTTPQTSVSYNASLTAEGARYARITVKDKAGNTSYLDVGANIDNTKPTCGTATNATTSWTKDDRTIKQACADTMSGCEKPSYEKTYSTTTKTDTVTITDLAGNSDTCTYNVYVDKTAPTFTSAEIKNISTTGYDIFVYGVSDNGYSGVNRVQFPTWTTANGQDDIQSSWQTSTSAKGALQSDGTTWKYRVNTTDHKNEAGTYNTHVYLYDSVGNSRAHAISSATVPQVTATFNANSCGTASSGSITKPYNNALGTLPTLSAKTGWSFDGWYTASSGGTKITTSTTMPSSNVTYYAHCTINKYTVTVTPKVDNVTYASGGMYVDGYFTFNVYANDSLVSSGANSYNTTLNYGTKVRVVAIAHRGYTITANSDVTATVGTSGLTFVPTWTHSTATITYKAAVMGSGAFQNPVTNGATSGTTGQSKTIDQFQVVGLSAANTSGKAYWMLHQQDYGDMPSATGYYYYPGGEGGNGGKRLEGIKMKLDSEFAEYFDIYYRVHLQDIGWLNWTSNDEFTGSRGLCKRMEALRVKVVPKGTSINASECGSGESCRDTSLIVSEEASNCPVDDGTGDNSVPDTGGSSGGSSGGGGVKMCTKIAYKDYVKEITAANVKNASYLCEKWGNEHLHTAYGVKGTFVTSKMQTWHQNSTLPAKSFGNCLWKEKYTYREKC